MRAKNQGKGSPHRTIHNPHPAAMPPRHGWRCEKYPKSNGPFFERLSYDVRVLIYSYLDFFPFPDRRSSSGLAASCRKAHEETAKEAPRQLWIYLQQLKKKAAKSGLVFRLAPSIDTTTAMIGLRTLTILFDYVNDLPFYEGLPALTLDRLEVRLLKDPFEKTRPRSRDGMLDEMLHAVVSSIHKAVGPSCEMNVTELALAGCSSDATCTFTLSLDQWQHHPLRR